MAIYILLLVVVIFCCIIETASSTFKISKIQINTRKLSFFVCFLFILFLGLFRNELLGVDVSNYKEYFSTWYTRYDFTYVIKHFDMDNGYILLNKIVKQFTDSFVLFKDIAYIIVFGLFSIEIYKKSNYPACSFLIYIGLGFLGINFCLLRQALAYSICFVAYQYLKSNKKIKFFLLVILAATFHKTAIFFLLVYPLTSGIFKCLSILKKSIFIIIFIFFSGLVIPYLFQFYINDYSEIAEKGQGISLLIFYFVIILIMSKLKKITKNQTKEKEFDYEASFCTIYFQIGALFFSLFTRITNFYALLLTISIPQLVMGSKNKKIYLWVLISAFSLMYFINLYFDPCNIVPYISVFEIL